MDQDTFGKVTKHNTLDSQEASSFPASANLYTENARTDTLANGEGTEEMPQTVTYHLDLYCLLNIMHS